MIILNILYSKAAMSLVHSRPSQGKQKGRPWSKSAPAILRSPQSRSQIKGLAEAVAREKQPEERIYQMDGSEDSRKGSPISGCVKMMPLLMCGWIM